MTYEEAQRTLNSTRRAMVDTCEVDATPRFKLNFAMGKLAAEFEETRKLKAK